MRREWHPAPGWPPPPPGFVPPPGWAPDPTWPSPPDGWRWWRRRRGLPVIGGVFVVISLSLAALAASDAARAKQVRALTTHGVTITARVLSSHYDPDGGDPGGWTRDVVEFNTATGTVQTTVGHHDTDQPERTSGQLVILYDPRQPAHAATASEPDPLSYGPDAVLELGFAILSLTVGSILVFVCGFRITKSAH